MKIAVPCDGNSMDSKVSPSFGRCPYYVMVDPQSMDFKAIENQAANATGGAGIKAAQLVVDSGASVVLALQCGQNAADVLKSADIKILKAVPGTVKQIVENYNQGVLEELTDIHPGHHGKGRN